LSEVHFSAGKVGLKVKILRFSKVFSYNGVCQVKKNEVVTSRHIGYWLVFCPVLFWSLLLETPSPPF